MNKTKINNSNFITSGPIFKSTIKLALPILIGHIFSILYSIVDTFFLTLIDRGSTSIISGIGLLFPILMFFIALSTGLSVGISSLVARAVGENNEEALDKSADSGIFLAIMISIIVMISLYSSSFLLVKGLAGNKLSEQAVKFALNYLYFIIPGYCFLLIMFSFGGVLQGVGLAQYFGICMTISTVINIILDPIFIFLFKMGVRGASIASSISILIGLIYMITIVVKRKDAISFHFKLSKIRSNLILEILRIGILQVFSLLALSIALIILNKLVSSISETRMNSWVLVGRMDEFIYIIGYSLGGATLTQVGQNYGIKNRERILKIYKFNLLIGVCFGLVIAALYSIFAPFLFRLFSNVGDVVAGCTQQVRILSFTNIGVIAAVISTNAFQGSGKALPSFIIVLIRMGVIIIPIAFICVLVFKTGIFGIFAALGISNTLAFLVSSAWCFIHLKTMPFKSIMKTNIQN